MHTRRLTGSTKTPDQRAVNNQCPHRNSTPRRLIHLHVLVPLYLLVRLSEILAAAAAAAAAIIIVQTKRNKERFLFLFLQKLDSNSIGEISYSTAAEDHDLPNKNKTKQMKKQQGTYYSRRRAEEEQLPRVCKMRGSSLSLSLSLCIARREVAQLRTVVSQCLVVTYYFLSPCGTPTPIAWKPHPLPFLFSAHY